MSKTIYEVLTVKAKEKTTKGRILRFFRRITPRFDFKLLNKDPFKRLVGAGCVFSVLGALPFAFCQYSVYNKLQGDLPAWTELTYKLTYVYSGYMAFAFGCNEIYMLKKKFDCLCDKFPILSSAFILVCYCNSRAEQNLNGILISDGIALLLLHLYYIFLYIYFYK